MGNSHAVAAFSEVPKQEPRSNLRKELEAMAGRMHPDEFDRMLKVIASGIDLARRKPHSDGTVPDDYIAWVIVQELRRAGFKILPSARTD